MAMCMMCSGSGQRTCPSCGGRSYHGRLDGKGDFEMSTCCVCAGRKHVVCELCRGSGQAPGYTSVNAVPSAPTSTENTDPAPLGRWQATDGEWFKFEKWPGSGNMFLAHTGNALLGETGLGLAVLSEHALRVVLKIAPLGSFTVDFEVKEDSILGHFDAFGIQLDKPYFRNA